MHIPRAPLLTGLLWLATLLSAAAQVPAPADAWCRFELPGDATIGKPTSVKIIYQGIKTKTKLACDLHWNKADGNYGGFLAWGGEGVEVQGDGERVVRFRIPAKEGLATATALVFLSPTGKYTEKTAEVRSQPFAVKVDEKLANCTYKKSWLHVEAAASARPLLEGAKWEVPVEYFLDPSEDDGGTKLSVMVMGPWIDCPNEPFTTRRYHESYPRMSRAVPVKAGRGREVLEFTVPPAKERNSLLLIAAFQHQWGERWPWEVRRGSLRFLRTTGVYEIESAQPGNLFVGDEPVKLHVRLLKELEMAKPLTLTYTVSDYTGATVTEGRLLLADASVRKPLPFELKLPRQGTYLIEADLPGHEKRATTFARIPDLARITGGGPTRFGMTNVVTPGPDVEVAAMCTIARRLGLSICRSFMPWNQVEPGRGESRLDDWAAALAIGNQHGIRTWFCVTTPPAWAQLDKAGMIGYRAFRCDLDGWRAFVTHLGTRFRGQVFGYEWLNEIVPGGSATPVDDYLAFIKTGTEALRPVDPAAKVQLAGGLWPRSFRLELLQAGAAKYVDILPVHYATGGAVREAADDLAAVGAPQVEVWDNETARGITTWGAPPRNDLTHTLQSNWILTNWSDELCAGAKHCVYFGGHGDPAGNWSYLFEDYSPRPVAATLAVFAAKLHGAEPLGALALGEGGMLHLFARGNEAVVLASTYLDQEALPLPVGVNEVRVVDYQGNATPLAAPQGIATLPLRPLRVYVEGADLDVLKAHLVPEVLARAAAANYQGSLKGKTQLVGTPRISQLRGTTGQLQVRLRNLYARPLAGTVKWEWPAAWPQTKEQAFELKPGEERLLPVTLALPTDAAVGDQRAAAVVTFAWDKLPVIRKPVVIAVIDRAALGNLLPNGDFEQAGATAADAAGFVGKAARATPDAATGGGADGLGQGLLKFADTAGQWSHHGRTIPLSGGETYLYTAWVWNRNMHAGSNVTLKLKDGSERTLHDVQVFTCGEDNPWWQVYAARVQAPADTVEGSFTPVTRGAGTTLYDNLRVSIYEGTDYAAEARRVEKPPTIDGKLDEWSGAGPVPLLGKNQLTVIQPAYQWAPANLHAVLWLRWDAENLYVAARVRDNVHQAQGGDAPLDGDCLVVALDPSNRGPESVRRAFAYYVSSAAPGGSGKHTLFRPAERAGGLRNGHLARDSSVYDLAITAAAGVTTYELRLPWSELGGIAPAVGTKFGAALQLTDNDGAGRAAAMIWGEGLLPAWAPQRFGVVTLVE